MGRRAELAAPDYRVRERCTDLFGRISWQWRVHRRSNAYAFRDPQQCPERPAVHQSENQSGTQNQVILGSVLTPPRDPNSPLERALARFDAAIAARLLPNEDSRTGFAG